MAGTDELFTFFVPRHQAPQIRAAAGKRRHAILRLEHEYLVAPQIHGHRIAERNACLSTDQHRLRLLVGPGGQQKLHKTEPERAEAEQHPEPHDGLTEKAPAARIVVHDGHIYPV
jgi:hypothetical protein